MAARNEALWVFIKVNEPFPTLTSTSLIAAQEETCYGSYVNLLLCVWVFVLFVCLLARSNITLCIKEFQRAQS